MSSKLLNSRGTNRATLAFAGLGAIGLASSLSVVSANADTTSANGQAMTLDKNVTAGSFDITKQASGELTFPVQFDRPSGVNAAALAGTVTQLGSSSDLYKSAVKAVPDLANSTKMNSLLSDALDPSSANYASARADIVSLINWYNSLGGQKITTQAGAAYTADNLDEPINVLAVAFSNNNSINSAATQSLATINNAKTVGDVETALNAYKSGVSQPYNDAFDAYAAKVYADGADLNALSQYSAVKPVLDAYQSMYANGAAAIRTTLLNGAATSTEAGVTFFESAVLAGSSSDTGGDGSNSNTPSTDVTYTTKYVDEKGNNLTPPTSNNTGYDSQKDFPDYTFDSSTTDDSTNTKTYVYKPVEKTADTVWVDDAGNTLKAKAEGTSPDDGKTTLFPGYKVISTHTTTDSDGNTHTVNTYHKVVSDTTWVDTDGKTLKDKATGEFPDNDGTSDIDGYTLVSVKTNTDANGDTHVVNTYEKTPDAKTTHTTWVDENGNTLKPQEDGNHPDNDGKSDVDGYTLVSTTTDADGNTINTYKKNATAPDTYWFDTQGNSLKDKAVGETLPDTDHNDITGYTWQQTYVVTADDLKTGGTFADSGFQVGDTINIYEKNADAKTVHTTWVDEDGNTLKAQQDGSFPDNDGKSDIDGYTLVSTKTDADGNVVNTYTKTPAANTVHTTWVDEDGKTLQAEKEGAYPDNDGVSDIKGYTLVSTATDADGNVKNVYTPNAAEVKTSWVDEDGNPLADDVTGTDFEAQKAFDGYELTDVKMSADGTHKYYVYTKKAATPSSSAPASSQTPASSSSATPVASSVASSVATTPETSVAKQVPATGVDDDASITASVIGAGLLGTLGLAKLATKRRNNKKNA